MTSIHENTQSFQSDQNRVLSRPPFFQKKWSFSYYISHLSHGPWYIPLWDDKAPGWVRTRGIRCLRSQWSSRTRVFSGLHRFLKLNLTAVDASGSVWKKWEENRRMTEENEKQYMREIDEMIRTCLGQGHRI